MDTVDQPLLSVPLHNLHARLGAKFVPFAGYAMPVQYPAGVLAEHKHTRASAGLFDVSHMGQLKLHGPRAAEALEALVPGDIMGLKSGRTRYTLFTNEQGGVLDDLMVTNAGDHLFLVVNASNKQADLAHLEGSLPADVRIEPLPDRALLAIQGPLAAAVMARLAPDLAALPFMAAMAVTIGGAACFATRSGYTGEDGYEISVPAGAAERVAELILAEPEVAPIGLAARDSLRLEAGLCLHGHDIDPSTNPIEADLAWTIAKRRREQGGFPGAGPILGDLAAGPKRRRVGILPDGPAPARENTEITDGSRVIGRVTSGGFSPSGNRPIAMGMVEAGFAEPGTSVSLTIRGAAHKARIVALPFVPHRYHRSTTPGGHSK